MESQKNSKGIIVVLITIIIVLSVLCILLATNTISFNSNSVNSGNNQSNANNTENNNVTDNANTENNQQTQNNNELTEYVGRYISISSDANDKEYFALNSDGTAIVHFITGDGNKPYNDVTVSYSLITENGKKVLKLDSTYPYWNTLDAEKISNGYKFTPREVGPSATDITFEKIDEYVGKYVAVSSDANDKEYFVLNSDGTASIHYITGDGNKPYNDITASYSLFIENGKKVLKLDTKNPYWNTLDAEKISNGYKFAPREVGPSATDITFEKK